MGHSYNCREAELVPIPRYALRPLEKLGSCHAGEVKYCKTISSNLFHLLITKQC